MVDLKVRQCGKNHLRRELDGECEYLPRFGNKFLGVVDPVRGIAKMGLVAEFFEIHGIDVPIPTGNREASRIVWGGVIDELHIHFNSGRGDANWLQGCFNRGAGVYQLEFARMARLHFGGRELEQIGWRAKGQNNTLIGHLVVCITLLVYLDIPMQRFTAGLWSVCLNSQRLAVRFARSFSNLRNSAGPATVLWLCSSNLPEKYLFGRDAALEDARNLPIITLIPIDGNHGLVVCLGHRLSRP